MGIAHVAQVAHLEGSCFADPWSERSIATELDNPLSLWLVAINEDRVVGYVGSQTVLDASDMMNIAVDPSHRREGIAEALVAALIEGLLQRGSHSLTLEVRSSNEPAKALYEKLGFCQVGCRKNYYRNPKEDAWIMQKNF